MRNYEIASGSAPIEYGAPTGFITSIGGKSIDPPKFSPTEDNQVLQGYATRWNNPLIHDGKIKVLDVGALDRSIKSGPPVRFQLDHDDDQVVATTEDNLELHSDEFGLAFRLKFPDSPRGRTTKLLAQSKARTAMSIGYSRGKTDTVEIDGIPVMFIREAELNEISLVTNGAVRKAYAILDAGENSLRSDSEFKRLLHDGSFVGIMRAFEKLKNGF